MYAHQMLFVIALSAFVLINIIGVSSRQVQPFQDEANEDDIFDMDRFKKYSYADDIFDGDRFKKSAKKSGKFLKQGHGF